MAASGGPITIWRPVVDFLSDTKLTQQLWVLSVMTQKSWLWASERPSPLASFIVKVTKSFWNLALAAVMSALGSLVGWAGSPLTVSPVGSETATLERGASAATAVAGRTRAEARARSVAKTTAGRRWGERSM
jgi:hypothetical protein